MKEIIQELKRQLDIKDVLRHYGCNPSNKGKNWQCNRHNSEHGNSVAVFDDHCYCLGCKGGACDLKGDIFSVIKLYENLYRKGDFSKVLQIACKLADIEYKELTPEALKQIEDKRKRAEIIIKTHAEFFKLTKEYLPDIADYIRKKRDITLKELEQLELGYLPKDKWFKIKQKIEENVPESKQVWFLDEQTKKKKQLINTYCAFYDRIIHPHFFKEEILYLTGEITPNHKDFGDKDCSKYVKLQAKFSATGRAEGYLLESLHGKDKQQIIFSEGYWDALKLKLLGIPTVTFGTCKVSGYFINEYCNYLKQFKKVITCFDTEDNQQGQQGAISFNQRLLSKGVTNLLLAELPSIDEKKVDIDSYINCFEGDERLEKITEVIATAKKFYMYICNAISEEVDARAKDSIAKELIKYKDMFPASEKITIDNALKRALAIKKDGDYNKYKKEIYEQIKEEEKRIAQLEKENEKFEDVEVDERFYSRDLLYEVWKELDKTHKLDNREKLAVFIVALSGELKEERDRCSTALKGNSSSGKDNCIDTVFSHFPAEDNFKITRGTASALEDEASSVKRIAFSEINKNREGGANADITETFKQLAEGGVFILKKDASTGFSETKKIECEQKTLLYGTTETESDDELETRYVIIPIKGYPEKNLSVIKDVSKKARDIDYLMKRRMKQESWIAKGIRNLDHDLIISVPYSKVFENKIIDNNGEEHYIFDIRKERVMRDFKRILALTKAITWIHQKQRIIEKKDGLKILYSDPADFITAFAIFEDFFNLTYSGLDHRLQTCYDTIKQLEGKHDAEIIKLGYDISQYSGWVLRHNLQIELAINSVNTIKKYLAQLKDHQLIETFWSNEIPKGYLIKDTAYQQGVNCLSKGISISTLTPYCYPNDRYIELKDLKINIEFMNIFNIQNITYSEKELESTQKEKNSSVSSVEIDGCQFDGIKSEKDIHTYLSELKGKSIKKEVLIETLKEIYDNQHLEVYKSMLVDGLIMEVNPNTVEVL
jgi:hypothetical protein